MNAPKLPHLDTFTDRHGRTRYYFRRKRGKRTPLPGEPFSEEFMAAYRRASGSPAAPASIKRGPGTIGALIDAYLISTFFTARNRQSTQIVTRRILERFAAEHGHRLVAQIDVRALDSILGKMAATPAAANSLRKKLHRLLEFGIKHGWLDNNPARHVDRFKEGTFHTWTEEEIRLFEASWPIGSFERVAFAIHLYTGQRRTDVCRMTWADMDGQTVRVVQSKTGARLAIPLHSDLKRALDHWPKKHVTLLYNGRGKQYTVESYGNLMADAIDAAGLPKRCVLHGLRKAAARRLAEAGCTEKQIASVTGHKSLSEVARYTAAASQEKLATAAISMLPGGKSQPRKKVGKTGK